MNKATSPITTFEQFATSADYSLMNTLRADPDSTHDGNDHRPRQVFSGHFVPVPRRPLKRRNTFLTVVAFSQSWD